MAFVRRFETDFGTIRVTRGRDGTMTYYQNGSFHSQAKRSGVSICGYVHAIHEVIRQAHARRVLVIGCAGGTLATMLRRLHCKVTVVDINPVAFAIARRYFRLPEDVRCVRRDGIAYLRTTRKRYDAVIVDVFGSNNAVPRLFTTAAFFHKVASTLSSDGIMVMNVITADDRDGQADRIAMRAQAAGLDIKLLDWPRQKNRNTLVVHGLVPQIHVPSGREPPWISQDLRGIVRRHPRKYIHGETA